MFVHIRLEDVFKYIDRAPANFVIWFTFYIFIGNPNLLEKLVLALIYGYCFSAASP